MDQLDEYSIILNNLGGEAVSLFPSSWESGQISIDCDGEKINYKIKNPDSPDRVQGLSDQFRIYCEELYITMANRGDRWTKAVCDISKDDDDTWTVAWKYIYDEA